MTSDKFTAAVIPDTNKGSAYATPMESPTSSTSDNIPAQSPSHESTTTPTNTDSGGK